VTKEKILALIILIFQNITLDLSLAVAIVHLSLAKKKVHAQGEKKTSDTTKNLAIIRFTLAS
jgi:hypothetical protein